MKVDEGFMHVWEEPTEAGRLHNPHPCREGGCVSADTPDTPALEGKVPRLDPQTHAKKWHRVLSLLLQLAGSKKCEGLEKLDHFDLHSVSGGVSHISGAIRVKGGHVEGQDLASTLWSGGLCHTLKSYETPGQCLHPLCPHPQGTLW